jgi:hypothetical protein
MRPILLTSLTTPQPTKTAQAWTADAKISGVESAENAGVRAAVMGAWCCSRRSASSYAGSGAVANI